MMVEPRASATAIPRLPHRSLVAAVLLAASAAAQAGNPFLHVTATTETVMVGNPPAVLEARIDTGAEISSIDATEIAVTRRERRRWVEFVVVRPDGNRVHLSAPMVRHARIKQGGVHAGRRPVILIEICLGSRLRAVEVSLADREGMHFDVLVGRNVLSGYFMVDPARDHVLPPDCAQRGQQ